MHNGTIWTHRDVKILICRLHEPGARIECIMEPYGHIGT